MADVFDRVKKDKGDVFDQASPRPAKRPVESVSFTQPSPAEAPTGDVFDQLDQQVSPDAGFDTPSLDFGTVADPSDVPESNVNPLRSRDLTLAPAVVQADTEGTEIESTPIDPTVDIEGREKTDIFDKVAKQQESAREPHEFEGFFNELGRGFKRSSLGVVAGVAGTIQSAEDFLNQGKFGGTFEDLAEGLRDKQKGLGRSKGGHPVLKFIANSVSEAVPFMVATLGATLAGGPAAGAAVAFSVEGDNAYQDALASGADEEDAQMDRMVVGTINAALEKLQIDALLGGSASSGKIIKEIAKAAREKAWKQIAKLGGKLGVQTMKTAVTEGIQEALQETVSIGAPVARGGEVPDLVEAGKRIGSAALGGAVAGGILGGGGAVIQSLSKQEVDADGFRSIDMETTQEALDAADDIANQAQEAGIDVEIKTEGNKLSVKELEPADTTEIEPTQEDAVGTEQEPTIESQEAKPAQIAPDLAEAEPAEDFSDFFDFQAEKPVIKIEKKEPQTIKEMKKDASDAIFSDPVFQIEEEALDIQTRQVDVGVFNVPENLKGEIKKAIEDDPALKFSISTTGKGVPYDSAIQEGLLQRTAGTSGELDIGEFLGMVSKANKARKKIGGVSEIILDKMIDSGQFGSEVAAVKHKMLHMNFTVDEINQAIEDLGKEHGEDVTNELLKEKTSGKVKKGKSVPAEAQGSKSIEKETKRQKDLLGRDVLQGGAAGKQTELFDKGKFKTVKEQERINAVDDAAGQGKLFKPKPKKIEIPPEQTRTERTETIVNQVSEVATTDFTQKPEGETSARQASINEDRESLGVRSINSKGRRGWEEANKEAQKQGLARKADRKATEILTSKNPIVLNDIETAGMTQRMVELKNEHRDAMKAISKLKDPGDIRAQSEEINRIRDEFDHVSEAVIHSGSEKGRALASQKLTLNKDFSLISVLNQAKAAAGKKITRAKEIMFEKLTKRLEKSETQIETLQKEVADLKASKMMKRGAKRFTTMKPQERMASRETLSNKLNQLLAEGCNN